MELGTGLCDLILVDTLMSCSASLACWARSGAEWHSDGAGHRAVQLLAVADHAVVLHHVQVHHAHLPARLLLHVGHREVRPRPPCIAGIAKAALA